MTVKRDLKSIIRNRQHKTGESYTAARAHVVRAQDQHLGIAAADPVRVEAAVLKVGTNSTARIRIFGEDQQVTLRSRAVAHLAPGQIITVRFEKRWKHRGDDYASGQIEAARIDVTKLGLEPLPLDGGELENLRDRYEHVVDPDPYAPLWRELTEKPRPGFEMHGITWGAFPDADPDDAPTSDAAELASAGDRDGAYELLMDTVLRDLRCLDAHAHLGNLVFDRFPSRALVHYEIGVRIGELSLPQPFAGVLMWSRIYNRPFLRCLHGYGLCLWRLGRTDEAALAFERMMALNPNDNQGARFCWFDVRNGLTWDEAQERDNRAAANVDEQVRKARRRRERQLRRSDDTTMN